MSPLPDLTPLLPTDEQRRVRRDGLVTEINATSPRRPAVDVTQRRVMRTCLAVAAVTALTVLTTSAVRNLGGPSVDVVSSARAAAAPERAGVLHIVVRYEHGPYVSTGQYTDGRAGRVIGRVTGDSERWSTADPLRQRDVEFLDVPSGGPQATIERAYAAGAFTVRNSWEREVNVTRLNGPGRAAIERALQGETDGPDGRFEGVEQSSDPVALIRKLLNGGALEATGESTVRGHKVQRLTGRSPGYTDSGGTWSPPIDYEYLVDATTYAPVQVTATQVLAARPGDPEPQARRERRIVDRWRFERFERLPLNSSTRRLLTIDTRGLRVATTGRR